MGVLYLDASAIIYLFEGAEPFRAAVVRRVSEWAARPAARLATSRLSRIECRSRLLREKQTERLAAYDRFFGADRLDLLDITADVVERATDLRSRYLFRTPDAIHLATALAVRADSVLTGDEAWLRCAEVPVELVR